MVARVQLRERRAGMAVGMGGGIWLGIALMSWWWGVG